MAHPMDSEARGPADEHLIAAGSLARAAPAPSLHHADYIRLLFATGRRQDAIGEIRKLAGQEANGAEAAEALGFAAFELGEHDIAGGFYAQVTELAPNDATAHYNLATALRNVGRLNEAEAACDTCLRLDPGMAQAALLRSHLKRQASGGDHVAELTDLLRSAAGSPGARLFLHYALGKELDDLGDYDAAFAHFQAGAALRRQALSYDVRVDLQKFTRLKSVYSSALLSDAPLAAPDQYAFVLGLPRSGTTLVERILTGRFDVRSNGETDNFMEALLAAAAPAGSDIFERAANADHGRVATGYRLRAGAPPPGGLVLEKMPLNYLYMGAIRLALPTARMVLLKRRPADNAFAMFSTLFSNGYPFSYDLSELAAYVAGYRDLMDHWKRALGESVMEVSYEALTAAPLDLGPKIATHVGVEWREAMASVERNTTASATASAAQVRQPIYRTSDGRWRHYTHHLGPLLDGLRAAGIDPDETA